MLWYAPSLRAKLRLPNESTVSRIDKVLVLIEFDRTYTELPIPRILVYDPIVSSQGIPID